MFDAELVAIVTSLISPIRIPLENEMKSSGQNAAGSSTLSRTMITKAQYPDWCCHRRHHNSGKCFHFGEHFQSDEQTTAWFPYLIGRYSHGYTGTFGVGGDAIFVTTRTWLILHIFFFFKKLHVHYWVTKYSERVTTLLRWLYSRWGERSSVALS